MLYKAYFNQLNIENHKSITMLYKAYKHYNSN